MEFCSNYIEDRLESGAFNAQDLDTLLMKVQQSSIEKTLQLMPQMIEYLITHVGYIKKLSEDFKNSNEDLIKHKDLLVKTIEQVEQANPGKSYEEILNEAATKTRENLKIKDDILSDLGSV